jgi:aminoglycoside phosphotransferase (APT) family kinase protein
MNENTVATAGAERLTPTEDTAESGTFTAQAALQIVEELCSSAGVTHADATVVQPPADNATIILPSAGLVARIAVDVTHLPRMRKELDVAAWFADRGVPAVRLAPSPPGGQLTIHRGRVVSWWRYLPSSERATTEQLAAALRRVHDQPGPAPAIGRLDPFARIDHQIAAATGLDERERRRLHQHRNQFAERWAASPWPHHAPQVLVHGDAHVYNSLILEGQVHLLDFEDTALGPWPWDLATPVMYQRIGWMSPAELDATISAYGRDPQQIADFDLLVSIRMLRATCWYASRSGREPHVLDQVRLRIASLSDPSLLAGWCPGW